MMMTLPKSISIFLVIALASLPPQHFGIYGFAPCLLPLAESHESITTIEAAAVTDKRSKSQSHLSAASTQQGVGVGPRISIREDFAGLERIHSDPDVFVIDNFLDPKACQDLIDQATAKGLDQSPVAYAGWTSDFKDLVELAAKGPVTWVAIGLGWFQTKDIVGASQVELVTHMVQDFLLLMVLAVAGIGLFTKSRADSLQDMRTSTSTTLNNMEGSSSSGSGPVTFVRRAAELFTTTDASNKPAQMDEASLFEAPTVIRYEAGQVLKPHYDANRSAATEDANRGGQTLATLIVYLNDVQEGGLTRFGKLTSSSNYKQVDSSEVKLTVRPKRGDALLFFPADSNGNFDESLEHEGCPAVDEKYIARIWRHQNRVPPPFGLSEDALREI